jgi:hypothetical protein
VNAVRVVLAALAVAAGGACRVDVSVGVDAGDDGTGRVRVEVTLDRDAAGRVTDLASQLRTADATRAGWKVEGPSADDDGRVQLRATKGFRSPEELTQVVEELGGRGGPFQSFTLAQQRSFLRTRTTFRGTVDLSAGLEAFTDEHLRARLGGELGVGRAELERQAGGELDRVFAFAVAARLPGPVSSNAPTETAGTAVWVPRLGERMTLEATAERWNHLNIALAATCVLSALALLSILLLRLLGRGGARAVSWG